MVPRKRKYLHMHLAVRVQRAVHMLITIEIITRNNYVCHVDMAEQASQLKLHGYSLASQLKLARLARTHSLLASSLESKNC